MSTLPDKAKKYASSAIFVVLFGPFAIVYLGGFLGQDPSSNGFFGKWFMGALTISGAIATISFGEGVRYHGWKELGCVCQLPG